MATDNTQLNTGTGGNTLRTLADASNIEWPAAVVTYATTVSPGANVLQVVTTAAGLPVAQQGTWAVTANAGTNLNTSLLALESGGNLASINTKTPALGQALAAASVPVVLTSAQITTLTPLSTVTANIGTSGSLALDATLTGGTQKTKLIDTGGTNVASVSAAGALKVDGSAVTQPVSGTVTAAQATAASLNATVVGTGTFAVQAAQSGTWNVGTVTTVTTVSAVTAISNALPAGTNLLGQMAVGDQIASVFNGTTAITPSYANLTTSSSGAQTLVAAVTSKKIYVLRWRVISNGATNVNLQSHTTTTLATATNYMTQFASGGGAYCPAGIMATATGEALDVNNSAAVSISVEVTYVAF